MAVQERLRALHAKQAERLALVTWRHKGGPEYHLIDDPDLRQAIGPLLGKIAHSHWWPVSRLGNEFNTVRGALATCPGDWTLDPLKIAILLRTADGAHLDARRAPGFLIALRRPEGLSEKHWRFQNYLLKPRVEENRLIYTTARPFPQEDVDAWWLCEETLRMVDSELHQIDVLTADLGRPARLRAQGVAGIESPQRLKRYVEVDGWSPIDARLHVSNVAEIVKSLGGEQLYGEDEPIIPLRELIQNASDAVRARRLLENRPTDWGRVTVRLGSDEQGAWVEVEDAGIGMSEAVLSGPLLDFGTTYWGSALMREEHEGLWSKGFEPTGRFGIGFFSVFMWGHRVRVITRRYDASPRETRVLEFRTGIESRPLVRPVEREEQLQDGGTKVRVWLNNAPSAVGGLLHFDFVEAEILDLGELCAWLAPALDSNLYVEDEKGCRRVVAASDWLAMDESKLFHRLTLGRYREIELAPPLLRTLTNSTGDILGRAAISTSTLDTMNPFGGAGVITVGGIRGDRMPGVVGIIRGSTRKAARDDAVPLADSSCLAGWASDQARMIADLSDDDGVKLHCAYWIVLYGGAPGKLPLARADLTFLDYEAIATWRNAPDRVAIKPVGVWSGPSSMPMLDVEAWVSGTSNQALVSLIRKAMAEAWGCSSSEVRVYKRKNDEEVEVRDDDLSLGWEPLILQKP